MVRDDYLPRVVMMTKDGRKDSVVIDVAVVQRLNGRVWALLGLEGLSQIAGCAAHVPRLGLREIKHLVPSDGGTHPSPASPLASTVDTQEVGLLTAS